MVETTTDPELLADVHFKTISVAYKAYFPPQSIPPTPAELAERWTERLADPSTTAFVARERGRVVGAVAARADAYSVGEGQLSGLHVLPNEWGRGVGSALHDAAVSQLLSAGFERAGLWVIAANSRARTMYERRQWLLLPGVELHVLGITEVRYGRLLSDKNE